MNNTFHPARFGLLFRKTINERPLQLVGMTGLVMVLVLMVYAFCKWVEGFSLAQNASFLIGLVVGGSFIASFAFSYFSSNAMGSSYLTLPASNFEKWLVGILLVGVLYLGAFLLFYRAMDSIFVSLYHKSLNPAEPFFRQKYDSVQLFPFNGFVISRAFPMFLNLAGLMLVGSLYFNKLSFIKMAFAISGIWVAALVLNMFIAKSMIPGVQNAAPYMRVWIAYPPGEAMIDPPQYFKRFVEFMTTIGLPAILWLLALVRLKEKEF